MYTQAIIIAVLVLVAVLSVGYAVLIAVRGARQKTAVHSRLQDSAPKEPSVRRDGPQLPLGVMGRIGKMVSSSGPSANLQEELAKAGLHAQGAAPVYLGSKIVLLLVGLIGATLALLPVASLALGHRVMITVAVAAVLSFVPNIFVMQLRNRRRAEVRAHMPDAVDLLEICVSSGMGLDMAWNLVGEEFRRVCPTLADEIALTNLEMHLGATRAEAMRHMAQRTGADEFRSLVGVLVQSERLGTSISDALQVFAASMRESRSAQVEEAAEKTAVKLLFPMILFIFPAVVMVLAGPAGLRLWDKMGAH